jgi:hypothetical protein
MSHIASSTERTTYLSTLLPYAASEKKTFSQVTSSLREYRMLLRASLECIHALENLDLCAFDALVGENMYQVRALKVALYAERTLASYSEIKISCSLKEKKYKISWQDRLIIMQSRFNRS